MAKYKIGDKVRIVSERTADHWNHQMDKWLGRVMTIRKDEADIATGEHFGYKMEEDKSDGLYGWYWWDDMIAGLANPDRSSLIVEIKFDGNTTRATLIKDGREVKSAEARCSPEDTFDRGEGAKVAVNRLFAKKEKTKKREPKEDAWEKANLFIVTDDRQHYFPIGEKVLRIMDSGFPGVSKYVSLRTGLVQSVSDHDVKPVGKER
nr:MAG TPA: hypothetical protein [Caudoviricetes sp.]